MRGGRQDAAGISRRRLIGAAGLGLAGTGTVLAGCESDVEPSTAIVGSADRDAELLNGVLADERGSAVVYIRATELFEGENLRETAELFAKQEQEHAGALAKLIEDLGGEPEERESDERYAKKLELDKVTTQEEMLRFAVGLENETIAAYLAIVARLSTGELRETVFQILANEAEHLSVLLGDLGEPQVPDAFVVGTPK